MTRRTYTISFVGDRCAANAALSALAIYVLDGGGEDLILDGVLAPAGLGGTRVPSGRADEVAFWVRRADGTSPDEPADR